MYHMQIDYSSETILLSSKKQTMTNVVYRQQMPLDTDYHNLPTANTWIYKICPNKHDDDITNTSSPPISFLQPADFTQYVADHSDESILDLPYISDSVSRWQENIQRTKKSKVSANRIFQYTSFLF